MNENAKTLLWVKCPICGEPDMRKEIATDDENKEGYIFCVNLACASNDGDNATMVLEQPYKFIGQLQAELVTERAKNTQLVTQSESRGKALELCNAALELLRPIFERHNPHRDPSSIPGPCMCEVCRAFALAVTGEVAALAAEQEKTAKLEKELEEVIAVLRKECDHEWQHEDDEFGTEQLHSSVCEKCGARKPYEPETFGDDGCWTGARPRAAELCGRVDSELPSRRNHFQR